MQIFGIFWPLHELVRRFMNLLYKIHATYFTSFAMTPPPPMRTYILYGCPEGESCISELPSLFASFSRTRLSAPPKSLLVKIPSDLSLQILSNWVALGSPLVNVVEGRTYRGQKWGTVSGDYCILYYVFNKTDSMLNQNSRQEEDAHTSLVSTMGLCGACLSVIDDPIPSISLK